MSSVAPARPLAAGPAPKPARDPWFDNTKMLLVTLVVVGHTWNLLPRGSVDGWLYDTLYTWHVPAFVIVTGYLSRSFTISRQSLGRLVTGVVIPYLVFSYALTTFREYVGGESLAPVTLEPNWPMWYLTAIFVWRLATPLLRRVPYALPVTVVISLVAGLWPGDPLDLARILGLLPFFTIGLLARREHIEALRRPVARLAAGVVFALLIPVEVLLHTHLNTEWLYWRASYAQLDVGFVQGAGIRLMLLALAAVISVCFFTFVPHRGGWFSRMGSATLVVYLFHGFAVKGVSYTPLATWAEAHPLSAVVVFTVGAVLLSMLLAYPPVARVLGALVDPFTTWQRRRKAQAERTEATERAGAQETGTALAGRSSR